VDKRINDLIDVWPKRNISGIFCRDKNEAVKKILEIIPSSASVGFSGSVTLDTLGLYSVLEKQGYQIYNQYKLGLSRAESLEIRKQGAQADYYLASANAISAKGELVFLSAYGNRIAGISYANNVIIVCGINKITPDLPSALKRAREYVTPLNCKRLNWGSPCFKDGVCRQDICLFPEYKRMCCQTLIIEAEVTPDRLKVVLVDEELGY